MYSQFNFKKSTFYEESVRLQPNQMQAKAAWKSATA